MCVHIIHYIYIHTHIYINTHTVPIYCIIIRIIINVRHSFSHSNLPLHLPVVLFTSNPFMPRLRWGALLGAAYPPGNRTCN